MRTLISKKYIRCNISPIIVDKTITSASSGGPSRRKNETAFRLPHFRKLAHRWKNIPFTLEWICNTLPFTLTSVWPTILDLSCYFALISELHLSGFLSQIFGGLASSRLNEDIVILTAKLLLYNLSCQFHCPDIVQIFPALALQSNWMILVITIFT